MSAAPPYIAYVTTSNFQFLASAAGGNASSLLRIAVTRGLSTNWTPNGAFAASVQVKAVDGPPAGFVYSDSVPAVLGVDYDVALVTTLSWAAGEGGMKYVDIRLFSVFVAKTLRLQLQNPSPSSVNFLGSPAEIVVTILPIVTANGQIGFVQPIYVSSEERTVEIPVHRFGGALGAVSVAYATENGSAEAGTDYDAAAGTILWADGETAPKTVTLTLKAVSADKSFGLRLSAPGGNATLFDLNNPARIDIKNVPVAAGSLAMAAVEIQVGESSTLTVKVRRVNGKAGAVGCTYGTSNGTAIAGTHYTTSTNTLSWADQDDADKSFTIPILSVTEALYLFATLTLPTGGAALLEGFTQARVTILDAAGVPPAVTSDDVIEVGMFAPFGPTEDLFHNGLSYSKDDVHVVSGTSILSGVIGFGGGTDSFGGGTDLGTQDFSSIHPQNKFRMKQNRIAVLG